MDGHENSIPNFFILYLLMLLQCPFLKINAHSGGQSWLHNAYQTREIHPAVEPGDSLLTYFSKSDLWLPGNSAEMQHRRQVKHSPW